MADSHVPRLPEGEAVRSRITKTIDRQRSAVRVTRLRPATDARLRERAKANGTSIAREIERIIEAALNEGPSTYGAGWEALTIERLCKTFNVPPDLLKP